MARLLIAAALCILLGSVSVAQSGVLLVSAPAADESRIITMIPVNYLDVGALAEWLGGSSISLNYNRNTRSRNRGFRTPSWYPGGYAEPRWSDMEAQDTTGGSRTGLNPNAPLAAFVPSGIEYLVGIQQ